MSTVRVEHWSSKQPRFAELQQCVSNAGQSRWFDLQASWHLSKYVLVALKEQQIVGFLQFVTQHIGPELDRPPVVLEGVALTEAKVMAFGVIPEARRQGVGLALQEAALDLASDLGCYQLRSHSGGDYLANHALKLAMGFAVHPIVRGDDNEGVYFIMPLKAGR